MKKKREDARLAGSSCEIKRIRHDAGGFRKPTIDSLFHR
jgi:hypothetical protein